MSTCKHCGTKTKFLQDCDDCVRKMELALKEKRDDDERLVELREKAIAAIILSTGDIRVHYDIIEIVFVMAAHKAGFLESSANPGQAFEVLQRRLRERAVRVEANAIVHCQFEYRVAVSQVVHSQVLELFAYGTAVKFRSTTAT